MKKIILLSCLFATTMSISTVSTAGLAGALQQPTHKEKKDFNKVNEVKKVEKVKKSRNDKSLEKAFSAWVEALRNKDIEALMALHTPDTVYITPDSSVIKGVENVKSWYKQSLPILGDSLEYVQESISAKGNLGAVVVSYKHSDDDKGQAMLVFRKAVFGKWLLHYKMENKAPIL